MNRIEIDYVNAALFGRIIRKDLCENFDSLVIEISKQTGVSIENCKNILLNHSNQATICAETITKK